MNKVRKKLGEVLKLERERKKISFEELASSLKMSESNLAAIENGEAGNLPSDLYFALFAKSYAEAIGIDYERTVEAIEDDLNQSPAPASDFDSSIRGSAQTKGSESGDSSQAEEDSSTPLVKLAYLLGGIVVIFLIFVAIRYLITDRSETDEYKEASRDVIGQIEQAKQSAYENFDWNIPGYNQPDKILLTLTPKAESWATILADGDTALFRSLIPGLTYTVEADFRIRVSIAIPSAVETKLNGQIVSLINTAGRRISKSWITQINLDSILNAPVAVIRPRNTTPAKLPQSDNQTAKQNPVTDTGSTGINNPSATERSKSDER